MTSTLGPAGALKSHGPATPRRTWLRDPAWSRPALWLLLAETVVLYLWNLAASGWAAVGRPLIRTPAALRMRR